MGEEVCAVPGCNNTLSEDQRDKRIPVCSDCEAAKMHLCEICSKKLSTQKIRDGATLCEECEMEPTDVQETGSDLMGYEEEYEEEEEEDFMV